MAPRLNAFLALLVAFFPQPQDPHVFTPAAKGSAAISGVVRDHEGQPIQGATVTAWSISSGNATVQSAVVRSATTDDLGRYRLSGLSPGEFIVVATINNTADAAPIPIRAMQPGEVQRTIQEAQAGGAAADPARADLGTNVVWGRVYYPGTIDPREARSVSIGRDDERTGIDIQLQLVTTHRIEGTVTMYGAPVQGVRVTVKPAEGFWGLGYSATNAGSSLSDDKNSAQTDALGRYAIGGLVPGTYEVMALNAAASPSAGQITVRSAGRDESQSGGTSLWASAQAEIAGADVTIPLTLQPGVNISGQVLFEGNEPSLLEVSRQRITIRHTASNVTPPSIQIEPTGRFQLTGVVPGRYLVAYAGNSTGRTWFLKTATADGVDVLGMPMEVRAGQDIRALILTLTEYPSRLRGTVLDMDSTMTGRVSVIVFPVDRSRWTDRARVQQAPLGTKNEFTLANLPDGDYFVIPRVDVGRDWNSEAMLERLTMSAVRVTMAAGKEVVCQLRVGS